MNNDKLEAEIDKVYREEVPFPEVVCDKSVTWVLQEGFTRGFLAGKKFLQTEIDELQLKLDRANEKYDELLNTLIGLV